MDDVVDACRRLSEVFHARIDADPALRPLFPRSLVAPTEFLALFLAQRMGGPADYTARRGKTSLICRHAHLAIGAVEGERWLEHMRAAMLEVGLADDARAALEVFFVETAATLADPLLPLYHLPLDDLRARLTDDPSLATFVDHGRTMLRIAAREWDLPRVALLLEFGADVRIKDDLGHDALYHTANAKVAGREGDGAALVALLIRHGAAVDGRSGPGGMTALHMAARRGSVAVAEALLASGAPLEARDAKGETPLRRAVNCGQEAVVRLLIAHGADPLSADKRGVTPQDAARTEAMRLALA